MYEAATSLTPEQLYVVSRQAFIEMALAGVTTVGEFHYLHHQPDGTPYDDEALLAKAVVQAARDVGLRIVLLRALYARAGFNVPANPRQRRFLDPSVEVALRRVDAVRSAFAHDALVKVGLAPHSVRAVPFEWLRTLAHAAPDLVIHAHVAEQPAEVRACLAEYGRRPVELFADAGLLSSRFTAVHAIHLEPSEVALLGQTRSTICACPSTERNLGDGIVRADELMRSGSAVCLGTDSQAHVDLLDEARQLEGHLRLLRLSRVVLVPKTTQGPRERALSRVLMGALTKAGAHALGVPTGDLRAGEPFDAIALDLTHPSLAGVPEDCLLTALLMSAPSSAVRDVWVQGRQIVKDGRHPLQDESARAYAKVIRSLVSTEYVRE
jgi:formimidoylglutamate deiminase